MTKRIVLISCVSKKLSHRAKAKDLYTSTLFKLNLKYAKKLQPDDIFILSAKHGLLALEREIDPYEQTLNNMHSAEIKAWANETLAQLKRVCSIDETEFVFLAGEKYRRYMLPHIKEYRIPMKGLRIGEQLQKLKKFVVSDECSTVHGLTQELKRHYFPFEQLEIPLNGIYVLFQKGEHGHGQNRIVRIGTHTGENQLRPRLKQHFLTENKDRSIFRKNIGRAILNQKRDPFLRFWEIDLTTRKAKDKYSLCIDHEYRRHIEGKVSRYIQSNFSFCVFQVRDKKERLAVESNLISTVSWCNECMPSKSWLGNSSPKEKIVGSGLWLVNELYKTPFDDSGLERLSRLISS